MGKLVDQLCDACEECLSQSPSGPSLLLMMVTLLGGPSRLDSHVRLHPYLATVVHVRLIVERLVQGFKMPEVFLVLGIKQAIADVLEDCAQTPPRRGTSAWSLATQRLILQQVLTDSGGGLTMVGDTELPAADRRRQARADLELWRKVTAPMLEQENLEQAIQDEMEEG